MRDFALLLILFALAWAALARPWVGVIALAVVGFLHPQGYATGFMRDFPAYLVLFGVVCAALVKAVAFDKLRPRLPRDWLLAVLALLWGWFAVTSAMSINPWAAWPKLWQVMKILPPLLLMLALIDTRDKLFYLIVAMTLAIALVTVKGGYWAVMTGFQDRVYGPPGSQYGDNNEFAIAVTMTIPLLVLWRHEARDKSLRWVIAGAIALSYAAVLSSWSRGALLSLMAVSLLLVWHSRRKLLFLPVLALAVALVFISLPETWFSRMETIVSYQNEGSAQGRLEVWKIALDLVREKPVFGGGFEGWIYATLSTGGSRDWHNAYLEMAAEHGLAGLGLWALLLFGSMASLTRLIMQAKSRKLEWVLAYGAMLRTSLAGYAVGAIFLGIAYWELLYWLIGATVILRQLARQSLCQAKPSYPPGVQTAPAT